MSKQLVSHIFLVILVHFFLVKTADANASSKKAEIFNHIFGKNYDREVRPSGENASGPVIVSIYLTLRTLESVNDVDMEFVTQVYFRQIWIDPRAKYSHILNETEYLILENSDRIWKPDLYFDNEKRAVFHQVMTPNQYTRVYPNGEIRQSYRLTLVLFCPMDFHKYPMDIQTCSIHISSYSWTTKNLILKWKQETTIRNPWQEKDTVNTPKFRAISFYNDVCILEEPSGFWPCLAIFIVFKRNFGYYLIQIYIPSSLIVAVSWFGFFLEPTATEARISVGVTTLLTIVTQSHGINQSGSVPVTSYIKALDIWTVVCQILVFGALLEFSLVYYLARYANMPCHVTGLNVFRVMEEKMLRNHEEQKSKGIKKAKRIDRIARAGFPLVFFLFNITYWISYLT